MAIVQTIDSFNQFYAAIYDTRLDQFSRYAWEKIYDYLEEVSDATEEPIEFDCVAWCCEFSEYEDINAFVNCYGFEFSSDDLDDEEKLEEIEVWLNDKTTVLCVKEDCILFVNF